MSQNISVHIGELVLHGFSPRDRYRLGDAVREELVRLLTEEGVPARLLEGGSMESTPGGQFSAAPGLSPEAAGRRIARALYGELGG